MKKYLIITAAVLFMSLMPGVAQNTDYPEIKPDYAAYMQALYALQIGDLDSAARFFDKVLRADSENLELLRMGYLTMARTGDITNAAKYAKLDFGKNNTLDPFIIVALELASKGNFQDALKYAKSMNMQVEAYNEYQKSKKYVLTKQDEEHYLIVPQDEKYNEEEKEQFLITDYIMLKNYVLMNMFEAWYLAGEGRFAEAIEKLQPMRQNQNFRHLYHMHAGMIHEMAGNTEEAVSNYEFAVVNANGVSAKGLKIAANALKNAGKAHIIEEVLENAANQNLSIFLQEYLSYLQDEKVPAPAISANVGLAEASYNLASILLKLQSLEDALMFYNFALAFNNDFHAAKIVLGEIFEEQGNVDKAFSYYKDFNFQTPFHITVMLRKALILAKQGEINRASKMLDFLIAKYPQYVGLKLEYANMLRENRMYKKAIPLYTKALDVLAPDGLENIDKRFWFIIFYRGMSFERAGLLEESYQDMKTILEFMPDNPNVLNYLGYTWLSHNQNIDEAFSMIEKAAKILPFDGNIIDSLGWAYYMRKDYENAEKILEYAINAIPNNSIIMNHLGDAYWKTGKKLDAELLWNRALQMNRELEPGDDLKIKFKIEYGLDEFEQNYKK